MAIELACESKIIIDSYQEELFNILGRQLMAIEANGGKKEIRKTAQVLSTFFQINNLRNGIEEIEERTIETKLYNSSHIPESEENQEELETR